jgi:hypothetical protein
MFAEVKASPRLRAVAPPLRIEGGSSAWYSVLEASSWRVQSRSSSKAQTYPSITTTQHCSMHSVDMLKLPAQTHDQQGRFIVIGYSCFPPEVHPVQASNTVID